jgi:hypothetical protein
MRTWGDGGGDDGDGDDDDDDDDGGGGGGDVYGLRVLLSCIKALKLGNITYKA